MSDRVLSVGFLGKESSIRLHALEKLTFFNVKKNNIEAIRG
jgi:hypothetical protein